MRWTGDKQSETILPLISTDSYRYYDLAAAAEALTFSNASLNEAQGLIQTGRASLISAEEIFDRTRNGIHRTCKVFCHVENEVGGMDTVSLQVTREDLLYAKCNVDECYMNYNHEKDADVAPKLTGCTHVAAAFLLLHQYLQEHPLGDATDYQGETILDLFRQKQHKECEMRQGEKKLLLSDCKVILEPCLVVDNDHYLKLRFRTGKDKLYEIKNLRAFVGAVNRGDVVRFDESAAFDFGTEIFDMDSQVCFELLQSILYEKNERKSEGNALPLDQIELDDFFELLGSRDVCYFDTRSQVKSTGVLRFYEGDYSCKLFANKEVNKYDEFEGIRVIGEMPAIYEGRKYRYLFYDGTLHRTDIENFGVLDWLKRSSESREIDFTIGRNHLTEFFYHILPRMEEAAVVQIHDREELQRYLEPKGKFVFYLDADGENVTCLPTAVYGERSFVISKDKTPYSAREMYTEREVLSEVRRYFPYLDERDGAQHCDGDEEFVFLVLKEGVSALLSLGEVQATDRFKRLKLHKDIPVTVGVQMESDLLNLTISANNIPEDQLIQLLQSYEKKKIFHRLRNGDFVHVQESSVEELILLMEEMNLSLHDFVKGKLQIPIYRALYLEQMLKTKDSLYKERDEHYRKLIKSYEDDDNNDRPIPQTLQNVLRGYQKTGYQWLRTIESCGFGGILADEMGLGKTLQIIALLQAVKEEGNLQSALIIAPVSLVYNWKAEFQKFAPQLRVQMITGTKDERAAKLLNHEDVDVFITSYDLLKRDIKNYEQLHFTYQIIDEAQYIKNQTTIAAKTVKVIQSNIRFALTGTPIENRLSELWSIFDYLMPGFLYTYTEFRERFEIPIVSNKNGDAMFELKQMVKPFILRRLKTNVLSDLPEKIEKKYYVQFESEQQDLYDGQVTFMRKILEGETEEEFQREKIQLLAELMKIRQICCDPALCFADYSGMSVKRNAAMELIHRAINGGHRVLIFSQFTSMLAILEEDLRCANIDYYKITGETEKKERINLVNRFNEDETPVFLVSLKAGGTGLNLTGADIVIHFDPWWNLAMQNQATDRAHRIGQTRPVTVYKLIAKDSIEEKILELQEQKEALGSAVLSGTAGGLMNMSKEELLGLL